MIQIYYNPKTGEIVKTATAGFGFDPDLPYINYPQPIRISDYRVNTETLDIEKL